jgi:peptidoglycan/LPS O-acetylase OafA/YrhL
MIFTHYTAANEWIPFGPLWTLAVEEQFYLLFPFAFVFLGRSALTRMLWLLILAAPLIRMAWSAFLVSRGMPDDRVGLGVYAFAPAHFDAFAAGALIALHRDAIARRPDWARWMLAAVAVAALAYGSFYVWLQASAAGHLSVASFQNIFSGIAHGQGREIWLYTIVWAVSAGLLTAVLSGERVVLWACRGSWLRRLGRVSYGGYVFNSSVYILVGAIIPVSAAGGLDGVLLKFLRFACALALIFGLAVLSFQVLEKRFLSARQKFG